MVERRISGVPVVDRTGRMVGILTEGDLLHRQETATGGISDPACCSCCWGRAAWRPTTCSPILAR
jgi:hypothetical protein